MSDVAAGTGSAPLAAVSAADELCFELPGGARALFTACADGNLSTHVGDGREHAMRRRELLRERLGLRWLCSAEQVHGTDVNVVRRLHGALGAPAPVHADAHVSAVRGVGAMVLAADCLPVALGCDSAVASVHAGWRGLAAGVLERSVAALREHAGEGAMRAVVGPAAGPCCYEVGPEVHAAFDGAHAHGRNLDLRAVAHERLHAAGVAEILDVRACTICDERFFSHRREGARAGRHAVISWSN